MITIKFYKKRVRWYYQWDNREYWIDMPNFFNNLAQLLDKENEITIHFGDLINSKSLFIWSDGSCIELSDSLINFSKLCLKCDLPNSYYAPLPLMSLMDKWTPYQLLNIE